MTTYLPLWVVAPALAALTVGYWISLRRPLGVSGVLARFSRIREEVEFDRGFRVMEADPGALADAMEAMTAEAFGPLSSPAAAPLDPPELSLSDAAIAAQPSAAPPGRRVCAPTPPLAAHALFLVSLAVGGLLAALVRGTFTPGAGMGESFARVVASGTGGLAALAGGGILVGFGTALCGGCTAGHGLTGCGRLMPGSLVSTALFFATAVGVSFLLGGIA
jgi:hypothetical protein